MQNSLKDALPFIARALGDKLDVQVKQGSNASTDGNVIYYPPLPLDNEVAPILAVGFIGHESGHIRETDFKVWNDESKLPTPLHRHVANILEDIRIEKKMGTRFPGVGDDLAKMVGILAGQEELGPATEDGNTPAEIMQTWMLYKLRHDVLGQHGIAGSLEATDEVFRKITPQGMAIKLEALMFEVTKCESTLDVVQLSADIIQMMKEEQEKEKEREEQQESQQQESSGNGGDQQQQTPDQGSADGAGSSGDDTAGNANPDGGQPRQGDGAGSGKAGSEVISQMLDALGSEGVQGVGEKLADALNTIAADATENHWSANSAVANSLGANEKYVSDVQSQVNALRHRMHVLLQAQSRTRTLSANVGVKLNTSHLHQAKLGGNVFQKKFRSQRVDTAVQILIDRSTSMEGEQIEIAAKAGMALALALEMVPGTQASVAVFPYPIKDDPRGVYFLSRFGQPHKGRAENFSSLNASGGTPMAPALSCVCTNLLFRREPRKICLTITDGQPDNVDATKDIIRRSELAGIETLGLGIGYDVSGLFRRHGQIARIDDLAPAMFAMLQDVLLAKAA